MQDVICFRNKRVRLLKLIIITISMNISANRENNILNVIKKKQAC